MTFVETSNMLNSEQYGFRKRLSCASNLFIARENWIEDLDNAKLVDVIYINFSKAFDKVQKITLLLKLKI